MSMRYTTTNAASLIAVRFFRSARETAGANTVRVWNSGGTQLSSATTNTVVDGGYITVTLPSPVALSAGQTFTVSVNNYTYIQMNLSEAANANRAVSGGVVVGSSINATPGSFPTSSGGFDYYIQPIFA